MRWSGSTVPTNPQRDQNRDESQGDRLASALGRIGRGDVNSPKRRSLIVANFCPRAVSWRRHRTTKLMDPNSIVIVSLHSPREKIWGLLLEINPSGVTMRGVDLNSFDHFVSQINQLDAERIGCPTSSSPRPPANASRSTNPPGPYPPMP